jgi:hypothetical protein
MTAYRVPTAMTMVATIKVLARPIAFLRAIQMSLNMFEAPVKPAGFIPARQAPDTTGSGRDHFFACEKAVAKKDELQEVLDKCLTELEYVRIILNADQQKRLSKLKHHTAARTAYLHSVDSDLVIIERQRSSSANWPESVN